jgi:hypothetical protein
MKKTTTSYILALLITIIVYGAIPFVSIPTLGQIVWTSGFAQSFVNAGWPAIKAINFGIPAAAPIPFGLANAFLQSSFMHFFSIHAWDAYALAAVVWLALGLYGCCLLAKMLGVQSHKAPWVALIYMTLPVVWWHASYSMLSYGFALLPLYIAIAFKLIYRNHAELKYQTLSIAIAFILVSCLAVFMDGYTYVMFFTAVLVIYTTALCRKDISKKTLLILVLPIIVAAAATSYLLYITYLGIASYPPSSMDFFRAWGVDVVMLLVPSQGIFWLWDVLHLSVFRSELEFFGDASVWSTTFILPLLIFGGLGVVFARSNRYTSPLLLIALVGLYFAFGPSLKINITRPVGMDVTDQLMPGYLAPKPTGNALIYQHVPGFINTRATYRWTGLLFVGLFGLTILLLLELERREKRYYAWLILIFIIITNLPHLHHRLKSAVSYRHAMQQMVSDLRSMNDYLKAGRHVVFYPQYNDFIVNYLASVGKYHSYNLGGDKSVEYAAQHWPQSLQAFFNVSASQCPNYFQKSVISLLNNGTADYVVLPYFDTLGNAHEWPPSEQNYLKLRSEGLGAEMPGVLKNQYSGILSQLARDPNVLIKDTDLYAIISLKNPVGAASVQTVNPIVFNTSVSLAACGSGLMYLNTGWSYPESWGIWSEGDSASLIMQVPSQNRGHNVLLSIEGHGLVGGALSSQAVQVYVNGQYLQTLQFPGSDVVRSVEIPQSLIAKAANGNLSIELRFKDAIYPADLGLGADYRKLALGLVAIKLSTKPGE